MTRRWRDASKAAYRTADFNFARLYPNETAEFVGEVLGMSKERVYRCANKLGLKKSADFFKTDASGRNNLKKGGKTRFKPGNEAWNKGTNFTAGGRSAETRFKKGNKPHTWQPIGSERLSKEGYLQRKVTDTGYTPRDWVAVHHLVWIEAYGPIPPKHRIVFRNKDKADISLENLELVSIADLMRRNTIHRYPPELRDVMRLNGRVQKAIEKRHEKQN